LGRGAGTILYRLLNSVKDNANAVDEWFRRCRNVSYCDAADPMLVVECVCGKVGNWNGLIKSSELRIAPTLTYGDFSQLLRFIMNSGFTIETVGGAGKEVTMLIDSEAITGLRNSVVTAARNLVKAGVINAARVAINVMLGDGSTYWELEIQECWPRAGDSLEFIEDGIRAALTLIHSLNLRGSLSGEFDPAVDVVRLGPGLTEALCAGVKITV